MKNKATWVLDPSHSELVFKVKHLMIANVKGEFRNFSVSIDGSDWRSSATFAEIEAASVDTNEENRDKHLKSSDFFDVENYPTMTFASTSFTKKDRDLYELTGVLTIKDIGNEITLDVEFGGMNKDPWGAEKAGFSFSGTLNRSDWNLNWNALLESGGVLVGDEVRLSGEVQFIKQA